MSCGPDGIRFSGLSTAAKSTEGGGVGVCVPVPFTVEGGGVGVEDVSNFEDDMPSEECGDCEGELSLTSGLTSGSCLTSRDMVAGVEVVGEGRRSSGTGKCLTSMGGKSKSCVFLTIGCNDELGLLSSSFTVEYNFAIKGFF